MGTEILVDENIEDGATLIRHLIRRRFDVSVALWGKANEESSWRFYIASRSFDSKTPNLAFQIVYSALSEIPQCSITPMDISICADTDPIARDAIELRDRNPSRDPKRYHGKRLGAAVAAELVVYPRRLPLRVHPSPEGHWQVLISEPDDLWLNCDSEEDARAVADARVLEEEAWRQIKTGPQFAAELEKAAVAMEKYHMGFGYVDLRELAERIAQ